jgi:hypothetical protein
MKIIALTGPKGSGKDTVAELIKELYPDYTVNTMAFADPIKQKIQHIFQLNAETNDEYDRFKRSTIDVFDVDKIMHSIDGRHVVREIGMMMREYDVYQFTNYVWDRLSSGEYKANRIDVITDLRFDNEYMMLKQHGAKIVKIMRPNHKHDGHITERGFDDELVDHLLMNDNSIDYLKIRVKTVVDRIIKGE